MKYTTFIAVIGLAQADKKEDQEMERSARAIKGIYDKCFAKKHAVDVCFDHTMGILMKSTDDHAARFQKVANRCKKNEECWGKALHKLTCGRKLIAHCKDDKKCWFKMTHYSIACIAMG